MRITYKSQSRRGMNQHFSTGSTAPEMRPSLNYLLSLLLVLLCSQALVIARPQNPCGPPPSGPPPSGPPPSGPPPGGRCAPPTSTSAAPTG